jgi:hypothetical protein
MSEQEAVAQGVKRREEGPFLPQYGTAYVPYDYQDAGLGYAIKSDRYTYCEYIGLQTDVSGPLTDVGKELAVKNVTHFQYHPIVDDGIRTVCSHPATGQRRTR